MASVRPMSSACAGPGSRSRCRSATLVPVLLWAATILGVAACSEVSQPDNANGIDGTNSNQSEPEAIELQVDGCPEDLLTSLEVVFTVTVIPETPGVTILTEAENGSVVNGHTPTPTVVAELDRIVMVTIIAESPFGATATADCSFEATCALGCSSDADCNDGVFCNGEESCQLAADGCGSSCVLGVPPCSESEVCREGESSCEIDACPLIAGKTFFAPGLFGDDSGYACGFDFYWTHCIEDIHFREDNAYYGIGNCDVVYGGTYSCDGLTVLFYDNDSPESTGQAIYDPQTGLRSASGTLYYVEPSEFHGSELFSVGISGTPELVSPCETLQLVADVTDAVGEVTFEWQLMRDGILSFVPGTETSQTAVLKINGWYCGRNGVWVLATDAAGNTSADLVILRGANPFECSPFGVVGGRAEPSGWYSIGGSQNSGDLIWPGTQVLLISEFCEMEPESVTWEQEPDPFIPVDNFVDNRDGTATFISPDYEGTALLNFIVTAHFSSDCQQSWQVRVGIGPGSP